MGLWDERFSRCYSIGLVLDLLEVLTPREQGANIVTVIDMGIPVYHATWIKRSTV